MKIEELLTQIACDSNLPSGTRSCAASQVVQLYYLLLGKTLGLRFIKLVYPGMILLVID